MQDNNKIDFFKYVLTNYIVIILVTLFFQNF